MNDKKTSNKGMTLVELLAALALVSVIGLSIYSVLFGGIKTYDRVMNENELRDEGDYIMVQLINNFYTLKSSEIKEKRLPQKETNDYYLVKTDGKKLGFIHSKIIIDDKTISLLNDHVVLTDKSKIVEVSPNLFEITLVLKQVNSNKTLELSSVLSIVNDRREDRNENQL